MELSPDDTAVWDASTLPPAPLSFTLGQNCARLSGSPTPQASSFLSQGFSSMKSLWVNATLASASHTWTTIWIYELNASYLLNIRRKVREGGTCKFSRAVQVWQECGE